MLQLAELHRKIDEAAEEMRHITQDDQGGRPQHRDLRQESPTNDDGWYDDFYYGNFAFDDASPLAAELQATSWSPSYKPPQLPMYDGHSDLKQFLMSYEATISSYGGNTTVMAKSFIMAVKSVPQMWYSCLRPGTIMSWQKLKDMLVISFQGFKMKPVTAQALFQCTQDHEEYLQASSKDSCDSEPRRQRCLMRSSSKLLLRGSGQDRERNILPGSHHKP
jgi:hypothetical protein